MAKTQMRVVMADDHEMVLHDVTAMLAHFVEEVEVVGTATTHAGALDLIASHHPDVLLCDIRLGKDRGLDLCRQTRAVEPGIHVCSSLSTTTSTTSTRRLRAEASGNVLKRVDGVELVGHLQRVMEGDVVIDPTLAGRIAMSAAKINAGEFWPGAHLGLTQREGEMLSLLVASLSNKGIAAKLVVASRNLTRASERRVRSRPMACKSRSGSTTVTTEADAFGTGDSSPSGQMVPLSTCRCLGRPWGPDSPTRMEPGVVFAWRARRTNGFRVMSRPHDYSRRL